MVFLRKFNFYFGFYIIDILSTFGLSSFDLSSALLRCGVVCRFIAIFYPCKGYSNKQDIFY